MGEIPQISLSKTSVKITLDYIFTLINQDKVHILFSAINITAISEFL